MNPLIALFDATKDPEWRDRIASEILILMEASGSGYTIIATLKQIGLVFPGEKLGDALQIALKIPFDDDRADALCVLIPVVPEEYLARIKETLLSMASHKMSLDTIRALVQYGQRLSAGEKNLVWETIITWIQQNNFEGLSDFRDIIPIIIREVPESLLPRIIDLIKTWKNPFWQAPALAALLPRCREDERRELLRMGMNAVDMMHIGGTSPDKVQYRVAFLPSLSPVEQQPVFDIALREAKDTGISNIPSLAIAPADPVCS